MVQSLNVAAMLLASGMRPAREDAASWTATMAILPRDQELSGDDLLLCEAPPSTHAALTRPQGPPPLQQAPPLLLLLMRPVDLSLRGDGFFALCACAQASAFSCS